MRKDLLPSRRRVRRIKEIFLNPFYMFITILSFYVLSIIIKRPTPLWQYFLGLPICLYQIITFINLLKYRFNDNYERLVLITNMNICHEDYWERWRNNSNELTIIRTDFSSGKFLLKNIMFIDNLLTLKGMNTLSKLCGEKWNSPNTGLDIFKTIELSMQEESKKELTPFKTNHSSEYDEIKEDCLVFIKILKELQGRGFKFKLGLLSQDVWNPDIYHNYRMRGYCI